MEYHKLQTGVLSPSKLRMKLTHHHLRNKSPSKHHQHSDLVSNTFTAEDDAEQDKSSAVGTHQLLEVSSANTSTGRGRSQESVCKKKQQQVVRRADSANAVHPARTLAEDEENHECDSNASSSSFEFLNSGDRSARPRQQLSRSFSRSTSSKWNDAEKWIPANHHETIKKQSQLITRFLMMRVSPEDNKVCGGGGGLNRMLETKQPASQVVFSFSPANLDSSATQSEGGPTTVRAVSMRDMGTEMTPMASQDPSRASTPMGATTPLCCSPNVSIPCTPKPGATDHSGDSNNNNKKKIVSEEEELKQKTRREIIALGVQLGKKNIIAALAGEQDESCEHCSTQDKKMVGVTVSEFEHRAAAWERVEKTKHEARFKREALMIQVWESRQKAKLEAEMKRMEAKVEEMRFQSETKMLQKIATARHTSEAKRVKAEARKNQRAQTRAGYIRRKGHIPYIYICCGWA